MAGAPAPAAPAATAATAPWWPVGTLKFALMTAGTLGLYHYYWLYESWKRMRAAGVGSPFWRTFFAPFTVYLLFERARQDASRHRVTARWTAVGLAAAYFVANVAMLVGVPVWLIGVVLLLPVLPAQITMARVNQVAAPRAPRNEDFSVSDLVILALGLTVTVLAYASDQYVNQLLLEWNP